MRDDDPIGSEPTALAAGSDPVRVAGAADARLEADTAAGEYRVVRFIGAGAMGDVYEGVQPVIGKRVAIKVLKRDLASSPEALARFTREARAVNHIDHPNVLDVFAFGRLDDGRLYFVMDLLEGCSLGEHLADQGALAPDEVLEILRPICEALDAAHGRGIVHRDLKPDNVFLAGASDGQPRVYVLDFGIAKFLHDEAASRGVEKLTSEGSWIGTPLYMAPEQWSSEEITARSDIYSLGVMAYQMVAGAAPFKAKSLPGLMEKHFHAEIPPLSTAAGPSVPAGLDAAIGRALAKKPSDRYASAGELYDAIADAIGGASKGQGRRAAAAATARPSLRPFDAARPADSPSRGTSRRTAAIAAASGLVAAGIAIAAFFALRGTTGESAGTTGALSIGVSSEPSGAVVFCNDRKFGVTPTTVEVERGKASTLRLVKPGYTPAERSIQPTNSDMIQVELAPITRFEGVWQRPDGKLRMFKRKGERVAGYTLEAVGDEPSFLRFYEFTPGDDPDAVVFGAVSDFVDGRADNEISCHIPLHAQYRYLPGEDRLELRLEEVSYDFVDGRCANAVKSWGPYEPVARLAHAGTRSHAVSRAGAALIPPPPANADDAAEQQQGRPNDLAKKSGVEQKKAPPAQNKAPPPKKKAPPPKKKAPAGKKRSQLNRKPAPELEQRQAAEPQRATPTQILAPPGE